MIQSPANGDDAFVFRSIVAALAAVLLIPALAIAAEDGDEDDDESTELPPAYSDEAATLELLLDAEVGVATKKARPLRESPGVVTLVTREDIAASGARDLEDVLLLVPGFDFGLDVGNIVGVGFRGNWGHEGKVLLLIDGIEMNEGLYSTIQFGHHLPVDRVERIEIIRGPGSAIYGGYAELAVVNVITRRPGEGVDGYGRISWGQLEGTFGRRSVSLGTGHKSGDLEAGFAAHVAQGTRSVRPFTDFDGNTYSMKEHGGIEAAHVNAFTAFKGAELRLLYDDYRAETRGGYGANFAKTYLTLFQTYAADVRWAIEPREGLQITPHAGYKRQLPWRVLDKDPNGAYYDKTADRMTAGVIATLELGDSLDLLAGADGYQDRAKLNARPGVGLQTAFGGETSVAYENVATYGQVLWDTSLGNIAAGARFEHHSEFGDSFVPRLGFTRKLDRLNVKLLAARAFRAPGIENVAINPDIRPERTTVFEGEAGYQISDVLYASVNIFDVTIEDPIIFTYDAASDLEIYENFDRTGTRGAEGTFRVRTWQADASLTASVYSSAGKNRVPLYAVPGDGGVLLGLAPLKLTAVGGVRVDRRVLLGGSAVLLGPRHGYLEGDGSGTATGVIGEESPAMLLNVHATLENIGKRGVSARLGVWNIAGTEYRHLQPYDGGHAPQPARDRELLGELSFAF